MFWLCIKQTRYRKCSCLHFSTLNSFTTLYGQFVFLFQLPTVQVKITFLAPWCCGSTSSAVEDQKKIFHTTRIHQSINQLNTFKAGGLKTRSSLFFMDSVDNISILSLFFFSRNKLVRFFLGQLNSG